MPSWPSMLLHLVSMCVLFFTSPTFQVEFKQYDIATSGLLPVEDSRPHILPSFRWPRLWYVKCYWGIISSSQPHLTSIQLPKRPEVTVTLLTISQMKARSLYKTSTYRLEALKVVRYLTKTPPRTYLLRNDALDMSRRQGQNFRMALTCPAWLTIWSAFISILTPSSKYPPKIALKDASLGKFGSSFSRNCLGLLASSLMIISADLLDPSKNVIREPFWIIGCQ